MILILDSKSSEDKSFDATCSNAVLHNWTKLMGIESYAKFSVCEDLEKQIDGFDKIISLGKEASEALTELGVIHFKLPHPAYPHSNSDLMIEHLEECMGWLNG